MSETDLLILSLSVLVSVVVSDRIAAYRRRKSKV